MTHRSWLRTLPPLLGAGLVLGLGACGSSSTDSATTPAADTGGKAPSADAMPGKGKPPVTLGDKNFAEQFIVGQLYAQALRAKGYTVRVKENIGSSEIIDKALTSGKLDLYAEYTGVIATELAGDEDMPKSADETYARAKQFEAKRGFTTLDKTPFTDADAIAVLPAYAEKNGLKTIGDLKKVKSFSFGAPPENRTRFQGVVGLKQVYGLDQLKFKPLAIGLQYPALNSGKIDTATVFTTDGQLAGGKYVVLDDTEAIFGFQNLTPVVNDKVLKEQGPEFAATLNEVSSKLTNEAMQKMNGAVTLDKQKPAAVADTFLKANGLK